MSNANLSRLPRVSSLPEAEAVERKGEAVEAVEAAEDFEPVEHEAEAVEPVEAVEDVEDVEPVEPVQAAEPVEPAAVESGEREPRPWARTSATVEDPERAGGGPEGAGEVRGGEGGRAEDDELLMLPEAPPDPPFVSGLTIELDLVDAPGVETVKAEEAAPESDATEGSAPEESERNPEGSGGGEAEEPANDAWLSSLVRERRTE